MAAIDPIHFQPLHKYFPDLTLTQLATAYMYSTGVSVPAIAQLRNVSEETVRDSLKAVCKRMELTTLATMGTAVQLRLSVGLLVTVDSLRNDLLGALHPTPLPQQIMGHIN